MYMYHQKYRKLVRTAPAAQQAPVAGKETCSSQPLPRPKVSTGSAHILAREAVSHTPPPGSWGRSSLLIRAADPSPWIRCLFPPGGGNRSRLQGRNRRSQKRSTINGRSTISSTGGRYYSQLGAYSQNDHLISLDIYNTLYKSILFPLCIMHLKHIGFLQKSKTNSSNTCPRMSSRPKPWGKRMQ